MLKVKLLINYETQGHLFQEDTYRVVLGEDQYNYFIQINLEFPEYVKFSKIDNGCVYKLIERS